MKPKFRLFDDVYSFLHVLGGVVCAYLDLSIPGTLIFIAYQYYERERWVYKRGDFIEWLVGLIIGSLLRFASGLLG